MAIQRITGRIIEDGAIEIADIADGAITDDKIAGVANTKITGTITNAQIADVATSKLTGTVATAQIADSSVTAAKLDTAYLTPTGDGSGLSGIAGGFSNMDVITSTSTWTNPGSVTKVKVTVVGGGGGGGGSLPADNYCMSGGGGGGGTAIEVITIPTSPVPVTVGAGGAGQAASPATTGSGGTGGTSSFGAYCSATGGLGGAKAFAAYRISQGGAGGAGTGGNLNFKGGIGNPRHVRWEIHPTIVDYFGQGTGGTTYLGGGSPVRTNQTTGSPGVAGDAYGGGGGGCGNRASGGPGAAGVVIVEY